MSSISDRAAAAAAEAARRAAEAARRAAEAAKKAAEAAAKRQAAGAKPQVKQVSAKFLKDELSKGIGRALKLKALGEAPATTLRTEKLGDGQANCLERAVTLAKPGDSVVLLTDKKDATGHAVVQRKDGSIVDPNRPSAPYASLAAYRQALPRYGNPAVISDKIAETLLRTPPGPVRDLFIRKAGLEGVASRVVADPGPITAEYDRKAKEGATSAQSAYDAVIARGGSKTEAANAAAKKLDEVAKNNGDPTFLAKLAKASSGIIETIATVIGDAASGKAGDHSSDQLKETVKILSDLAGRAGDATAKAIGTALAAHFPNDGELHEVDDAFYELLIKGGDSALAREVVLALSSSGKTEAAKGFEDNELVDNAFPVNVHDFVRREIESRLKNGESAAELADAYGDYLINDIANAVTSGKDGLSDAEVKLLAKLAQEGGPATAQALGDKLAAVIPDADELHKIDDALKSAAGDGNVALASATLTALARLGKTTALKGMKEVATEAVSHAKSENDKKKSAYEQAEAQLGQEMAQFGNGLNAEQKQAYVKAFWADPANAKAKSEYSASQQVLSDTVKALAPTLQANAIAGDSKSAEVLMAGIKALANSPEHARDAIDFVAMLGKPENKALFDVLNKDGKLEDKLADDVLAPAMGNAQAEALADGSMDSLVATLKSITSLGKNFSKLPGQISKALDLRDQVDALVRAGKTSEQIAQELQLGDLAKGWDDKSKLGKAMAIFGVVSAIQAAGNSEGGLEKLRDSLSAVKGGLELTAGVLASFGKAGRLAGGEAAATFIAKYIPYAGLVADGAQLAIDIKNLVNGGNAGDYIATVGTVINLASDVVGFIPFVGTAFDGVLTTIGSVVQGIGGLISGIINGNEESEKRRETWVKRLEAAGVDKATIDTLIYGTSVDNSALATLGLSREQYLEALHSADGLKDQKDLLGIQVSWDTAAALGLKGDDAVKFVKEFRAKIHDMSWDDFNRIDSAIDEFRRWVGSASLDGATPEQALKHAEDTFGTLQIALNATGDLATEWHIDTRKVGDANAPYYSQYDQR